TTDADEAGRRQLSVGAALSYSVPVGVSAAIAQLCSSAQRWGLARPADTGATPPFLPASAPPLAAALAAPRRATTSHDPISAPIPARSETPLEAARPTIRRYLALSAAVLAALAAGAVLFASWITPILFGPRFAPVARLLPWTMFGCALFGMAASYAVYS